MTEEQTQVDAVLETADGRVVGVEVKASATVRSADLAGLRNLQRQAGPRFVAGYVLYTGAHTLSLFGDNLSAVPVDALWHVAP